VTAPADLINQDKGPRTEPYDVVREPIMLGLGDGTVLLRGPAVAHLSRALDWMLAVHARRDSVGASKPLRDLQQLLATEAAQVSARTFADVREAAAVPISPQNMINAQEAAAMLRLSDRHVRRIAGDLGGRQIAGRWVFDRDQIAAYDSER